MTTFRLTSILLLFAIGLSIRPAQAQNARNQMSWFSGAYVMVDSVYTQIDQETPGRSQTSGGVGGLRGEIGAPFFDFGFVSVGGSYFDGGFNFQGQTATGASTQTVTLNYLRDLRAFFHFPLGQLVLSFGYGESMWYSDLLTSYRIRIGAQYAPVRLTYFSGPYYYAFEYAKWLSGQTVIHSEDLGGGRAKVTLNQDNGNAWGIEFGRTIGFAPIAARVFVGYQKWSVDSSASLSDGVQVLNIPKNRTDTFSAGAGIYF